jgi:type 1 glutamine amidotransferase
MCSNSNRYLVACFAFLLACSLPLATAADEALKALIIDGQNNHTDWPQTTAMMRQYLRDLGGFEVDVARTRFTWNGKQLLEQFPLDDGRQYTDEASPKSDPDYAPPFSHYDVVISNFGHSAADWPDRTKTSFEQYVQNGGGLVIVHAANNSFGNWPAFNQMIGLGGWDGRNETSGPYVYYDPDGNPVRDPSPGPGGGHGPQHEFQIVIRDDKHPITNGLPASWLHSQDELYHGLRGPAENMKILATAYSAKKQGGTDRHEPMLMTVDYGRGRVFHTPMGHASYSMECVGFITVFVRGCQWAAQSEQELMAVPSDFPSRDKSSARKFKASLPKPKSDSQ